jgi:hypothetical protein
MAGTHDGQDSPVEGRDRCRGEVIGNGDRAGADQSEPKISVDLDQLDAVRVIGYRQVDHPEFASDDRA